MNYNKDINFDSLYGTYNYTNAISKNYTPFNCKFKMNEPIKNPRKIFLKSVEMPIFFYNVRTANKSNILSLTVGSTNYNISMVDKNYNDISTLLTDINAYISNYGISNLTFALTTAGGVRVYTTNSVVTLNDCIMFRTILGFQKTDILIANYILASSSYNLAYDTYLNFVLKGVPASSNNANGFISSFKLPLNALYQQVYYYNLNSFFDQTIELTTDEQYIINELNVVVYDRFGFEIDNYGGDWSFTLNVLCAPVENENYNKIDLFNNIEDNDDDKMKN